MKLRVSELAGWVAYMYKKGVAASIQYGVSTSRNHPENILNLRLKSGHLSTCAAVVT